MSKLGFNNLTARWRSAWAASAAGQFVAWWGRELAGLLPAKVRSWFAENREDLFLQIDGEEVVFARAHPRLGETDKRFSRSEGVTELKTLLAQISAKSEEQPRVVLAVPPKRMMIRQLNLPMAAQDNLAQVVGFEMDRQTPFKADQTYYDHRVIKRDAVSKILRVEFAATPRAVLDAELKWFQEQGIGLDAVDGLVSDPQAAFYRRQGFNVLPLASRAKRTGSRERLNWIFAAIVLALLGVVMHQSLVNREKALLDMQAAVDKVDAENRRVRKLRKELVEAVNGANFLAERRTTVPRLIELFKDLTERLPEHTFVQSITLNQGKLRIAGQSKDANSLIAVLQRSPLLTEAMIEGQVSTDPRTNKEVFAISAKFKSIVAAEAKAKAEEEAKKKAQGRRLAGGDDADAA